jgi:hypothetical protein
MYVFIPSSNGVYGLYRWFRSPEGKPNIFLSPILTLTVRSVSCPIICVKWFTVECSASERPHLRGLDILIPCKISGFRHGVDEVFTLLGCYTAYVCRLLISRDSLSVPSFLLKTGPRGRPKTSVNNYKHTLRNIPEDRRPHYDELYRSGMNLHISFLLWLSAWHSDIRNMLSEHVI